MKKINSNLFKNTLNKFVTGVTIITICNNDFFIGKTINSFASLSLKPALITFNLDKNSSSVEKFTKTSFLGINILSHNQQNLSNHFSKKQSEWEDTNYFISKNRVPMIKNCIANLNCKKVKTLKEGDHIIFICKINEAMFDNSKKPLIYFNSKYI